MFLLSLLILNIFIMNFGYSLTSPGQISPLQINNPPLASVYGLYGQNVLQPLVDSCAKYNGPYTSNDSYPLLILNENSYFSMGIELDQISLSFVSNEGIYPIEIQPNLKKISQSIATPISYDDSLNAFLFLDENLTIYYYSIEKDTYLSFSSKNPIKLYSNPYYDYSTKNYYVPVYYIDRNDMLFNQIMVVNLVNQELSIFNIEISSTPYIQVIHVSAYGNSIILFGKNQRAQKSYLYSFDKTSQDFTLLDAKDYDTTMITGLNSQYLLFTYSNGTITELFDLKDNSTSTFENTCTETTFTNSFFTSVIPKSIFSY